MELKGIISIAGRPGLFKIVSQGKVNVIVESLLDKKRFPAFASEKISSIEDISIFTYEEDVKLTSIFEKLYTHTEGKESISHKVDETEMRSLFIELLPNYDAERVYLSDIRKVFQWYNLLLKEGLLTPSQPAESTEKELTEEVASEKAEKTSTEKGVIKKSESPKNVKSAAPKVPKTPKPAASKKAPVIKTGSSRGK